MEIGKILNYLHRISSSILDYLLPPDFNHSFEKEFQGVSRLFVLVLLFSAGLTFVFSAFYIISGRYNLSLVTGVSTLLFIAFIYLLKVGKRYGQTVILTIVFSIFMITTTCFFTGGISSPVTIYFIITWITGETLYGGKGLAASVVGTGLAAGFLFLAGYYEFLPPTQFSEQEALWQFFAGVLMTAVQAALVVAYFRRSSRRYQKQLELTLENKNDLVNIICHDMANPLFILQGKLELIQKCSFGQNRTKCPPLES